MYLTKLEISNSVNDNLNFIWKRTKTEEETSEWIKEKKSEEVEYNTNSDYGRMSRRHYYFETYTLQQFLELDITKLNGLTVADLFIVFKNI